MAFFHFHSQRIFTVSLRERTITDFSLSGFPILTLEDFYRASSRENFHRFCPQWLYIFIPQRIFTMSLRERTINFNPRGFLPCLLKENFHGYYPQLFSFYFKSPTVLSSKDLLFYFCDAWVCGLMSIDLQMVSSIGFQSSMLKSN